MTQINPTVSYNFPVTRQTLLDQWDGGLSGVGLDDFADGFMPIVTGSTFSDAPTAPQPGQFFWHLSENVMYVYHDEVADTGVSLWLAIGPDKFETPFLTTEEIPAGYPIEITVDRKVQVDRTNQITNGFQAMPRLVGFNQSGINTPVGVNDGPTYGGETAASGTWIRGGVDGIVYAAMENAESHPSQGFQTITTGAYVALSDVASHKPSVIGFTGEPLIANLVGQGVEWAADAASLVPTEPTHLLKIMFAPRVSRRSYYKTV